MPVTFVYQTPPTETQLQARRNNLLYEVLGRKYRVELIALTDSSKVRSIEVLSDTRVPQIGSSYNFGVDESDLLATCTDVQCKATASPKIWKIIAEYDTDRIVSLVTDNPLNQPAVLQWEFEGYEKAMVRDSLGVPVRSSSGNAFSNAPMREVYKSKLVITRNEAVYNSNLAKTYQGKLNSKLFGAWAKLSARINNIGATYQLQNGVFFWQIRYELEFRDETFCLFLLDQDFRDADGLIFRDTKTTSPMTNETPLNGRGRSIFQCKSILAAGINNVVTAVTIPSGDVNKFPPAPKPANADGIIPGPHWSFQVVIEPGTSNEEVVTIILGAGTNTWTVVRGQNGTVAVAHAINSPIALEPYFLRFIPDLYVDFTPLNLPVA